MGDIIEQVRLQAEAYAGCTGPRGSAATCATPFVSLTADGVLFAKNSDRDPNEAQLLRWHGAADHEAGSTVDCTWISIPQVAHTHAVLLSQPWWMWGAEIGTNEHGVVIGNEAVFTRELALRLRPEPDALLGMDLLRLGLERAATAGRRGGGDRRAAGGHGQGGSCSHDHPKLRYHNSFLVADPIRAIVLETAGRVGQRGGALARDARSPTG